MQAGLTREECKIVQASFAQVDVKADHIASLFYAKLFELDPTLSALFQVDIVLQGTRFMEKLAIAVKGLDDLESIVLFVQTLGRRHAGYGVKAKDYDSVGVALTWALKEELGPNFGPGVMAAWASAYKTISSIMIEAADSQVAS